MKTQSLKPLEARENASDQVIIAVSFASNQLGACREFSGPIAERRKQNKRNLGLLYTLS